MTVAPARSAGKAGDLLVSGLRTLAGTADRAVFGGGDGGPPDLDAFTSTQQLAYRCAEEVAAALRPGDTERQVARRMRRWLERAGASDWFHLPFAWFGDRTAFSGFRVPTQFLPTNRRLEEGMPFILDCAPVVGAATADIGYSGALGDNPALEGVRECLAEHRELVLAEVRKGRALSEVYRAVDRLAARQGLENRHRAYPGRVLAHRVEPLVAGPAKGIPAPFGLRHLRSLGGGILRGMRDGVSSPLWNDGGGSDHPATPGLWAVEPHLARAGVGSKFEELLVVTETDAYWLDEDLPHVRRWRGDPQP